MYNYKFEYLIIFLSDLYIYKDHHLIGLLYFYTQLTIIKYGKVYRK